MLPLGSNRFGARACSSRIGNIPSTLRQPPVHPPATLGAHPGGERRPWAGARRPVPAWRRIQVYCWHGGSSRGSPELRRTAHRAGRLAPGHRGRCARGQLDLREADAPLPQHPARLVEARAALRGGGGCGPLRQRGRAGRGAGHHGQPGRDAPRGLSAQGPALLLHLGLRQGPGSGDRGGLQPGRIRSREGPALLPASGSCGDTSCTA
jgi:hypothetical protein